MTASFRSEPQTQTVLKQSVILSSFSQFDSDQAKRLHELTVHQLNQTSSWSRTKWADEFRLLRQSLASDAESRISQTLDWYVDHCQESDVPSIQSAAAFRRHFSWLEECRKKHITLPSIISLAAKDIAKRVLMRSWPNGSRQQIEQVIQLSLDRYAPFRAAVFNLRKTQIREHSNLPSPKKHDSYLALLDHLWNQYLITAPESFIESWMYRVHDSLANWEGWSGNLLNQAFDFEGDRFQRVCRGWADSFGTHDGEFERFCDEVRNT